MHHQGPLPLKFEGPEQGFGSKNCKMGVRENPVNLCSGMCPKYWDTFTFYHTCPKIQRINVTTC